MLITRNIFGELLQEQGVAFEVIGYVLGLSVCKRLLGFVVVGKLEKVHLWVC
jgi:hypothetical protein